MNKLKIKTNKDVESVFEKYPESVREKLLKLRKLILDAAEETNGISNIEETLKWGEPSYLTDKGSTVRLIGSQKLPISMLYTSNVQVSWCLRSLLFLMICLIMKAHELLYSKWKTAYRKLN